MERYSAPMDPTAGPGGTRGDRVRKPGHRLLLATAATLGALLVAEWLLDRFYPVGLRTYRVDAALLHDTIPGSRRLQRMPGWAGGGHHLVRFNDVGCRGPELEAPGSRRRLVVIGDSLVLAANVSEESTFPAQLEARLGGEVEVVNAGLESYGPDQALLRLERDFDRLDPDAVLLVLCATNDFGDLLRNKLFRLEGGQLVRCQPALSDEARRPFEQYAREARRPALVRALRAWRSSLGAPAEVRPAPGSGSGLVQEYLEQAAWEYKNTFEERDSTVYNLQQDAYDADVAVTPDAASSRYKQALLRAVLQRLVQRCEARRTPVLAVVVPSAVDLDPGFFVRVDPLAHPGYRPENLGERMAASASGAGLAVLDLFQVMAGGGAGDLFVGGDDFHWNESGIELAAEATAPWLSGELGW